MDIFDPKSLIESFNNYGGIILVYAILFSIIFAESGLLFGFFLPGDSLLFTVGFLASQKFIGIDIRVLVLGFFIAAVLGDTVGYVFGHKVGKRLFREEDSILFHKDNLEKTKDFYRKHGKKTIILARFMPIIRTFAPIVAGIGDMEYSTFISFNVIGGFIWAVGLTLAGYFLGRSIPDVDRYLLPIIILIILLSVLPGIMHILKTPEDRRKVWSFIKKPFKK